MTRDTDSLLKLLASGRKMCLAPIAAGGAVGVGQLSQGRCAAAILSASTGVAMTLILLGGIALGSLLVTRLTQRKKRIGRVPKAGRLAQSAALRLTDEIEIKRSRARD